MGKVPDDYQIINGKGYEIDTDLPLTMGSDSPSNLNYNAPQDSPDRKGIAEAQQQSRPSNTELREAIDIKLNSMFGQNYVETDEGTLFTTEIADELLPIFQAREQQLLTKEREPMNNNTNYEIGEDVVLEMLGDGKYKVYANPKYIEAAKQQLLTELLGAANTYSNDGDFSDDAPSLVEAVPVSAIEKYREGL